MEQREKELQEEVEFWHSAWKDTRAENAALKARIAEYAEMVQESTGAPPSDTEINDFIWFSLADEMNLDADDE